MVIVIDTAHDSPAEIQRKIEQAQYQTLQADIAGKRAAKLAAFGKVAWSEDPLSYQKKLRNEQY